MSFDDIALVYMRTMGSDNAKQKGHSAIDILQRHNVKAIDSLDSIMLCDSKLMQHKIFIENKISIPLTHLVSVGSKKKDLLSTVSKFKNMVVIKADGCGGNDVHFVEIKDKEQIGKIFNKYSYLNEASKDLIVQEYIPAKDKSGFSHHYRVLVVKDEIIKVYKYTSSSIDKLASNVLQGGKISEELEDVFTSEQKKRNFKSLLIDKNKYFRSRCNFI